MAGMNILLQEQAVTSLQGMAGFYVFMYVCMYVFI